MKAVTAVAPGQIELADAAAPDSADRAIVRVREVGICGTDLKIIDGSVRVDYPRIVGHEVAGEVVSPGPRGLFRAGERVLLAPEVACGHCPQCREDRPQLCGAGGLMGRDVDGGFAEQVAVDELQLHALPDAISWEHAPLVQVLGTCVHGQSLLAAPPADQAAAVVGLGVSGLLHVQLLRSAGTPAIIGVTRSRAKRDLALQLGAAAAAAPEHAAAAVAEVTGGQGAAVVVETSGTLAGLAQAIELARPGGQVLLFGIHSQASGDLPLYQVYLKELRLVASRAARPRDYDAAIALARRGAVALAPIMSDRFDLDEVDAALRLVRDGAAVLKVTMRVHAG